MTGNIVSIRYFNIPFNRIVFALAAIIACLPLPSQSKTQPAEPPRIQLAILLDTSSSMDGLIDQTRKQLWQIVNEFGQSKRNGVTPILEVAVYEYGNDNLPAQSGYIRQLSGLTGELDKVSEALFALTTNGGSEYCGAVIDTAVKQLQWSQSSADIKAIFIAGNEPFTQGPTPYKQAVNAAKAKGISINTIHAGSYEEGAQSGWQDAALLAAGNYMSIDHNYQVAQIAAPQDQRIAELNKQLNETYIPYGAEGQASAARQQIQDQKNSAVSLGQLAERVKAKASSLYNNSSWDLVDALEQGNVELEDVKPEQLPEPMKAMSDREKLDYVAKKTEQRGRLQEEIANLSKQRDEYIAGEKRKQTEADVNTVDDAMSAAIKAEGAKKGFVF